MFPYQLKILASYEKNKDKKETPVQLPINKNEKTILKRHFRSMETRKKQDLPVDSYTERLQQRLN